MARNAARSQQLSEQGVQKVNSALEKFGTISDLAAALPMSRTTITNFLKGEPVVIQTVQKICKKLKLTLEDADFHKQQDGSEIDALVQQARSNIHSYIQERCGSMRVLDMTQSIELDDIYIHVNILERLTKLRGLGQTELLEEACLENFDRFWLGAVREKRILGLEAVEKYKKLMILGKPGAGKTTFLKHLAIGCNVGKFQAQRVPIFVTLKEFAEAKNEPDLLTYMTQLPGMSSALSILQAGRSLILLDGLDEVRETDSSRVLREIQQFGDRFCDNQMVITCRIAAREYTFQRFTEVEVADFNDSQIADFVKKWFVCKKDKVKGEQFLKKLEDDAPIRELATSPLLLTMLCFSFEDTGNFPTNRSELYENGLDVLLKKWDVKRNIQRDEVYKKLSLKRKEDLLSQIAKTTFEAGNYFFKQKEAERQITAYIENLPDASTDPEALQLDSEAVLKSIEAQHGLFVERARNIYSFSHLTFHEYFAARKIATSCNQYAADDPTLQALVSHITKKRWREVIVLTVGMLESADFLLQMMKKAIDEIAANDKEVQEFLQWANQKSISTDAPYKGTVIRAFYLGLALNWDDFAGCKIREFDEGIENAFLKLDDTIILNKGYSIAKLNQMQDHEICFPFDQSLLHSLRRSTELYALGELGIGEFVKSYKFLVNHQIEEHLLFARNPQLKKQLEDLKSQLPNFTDGQQIFDWWQEKGHDWTEHLRSILIRFRNLHDWQFEDKQFELMEQYEYANELLVDCLKSECYVNRAVREEIEATLLLPSVEAEG